MEVFFSDFASVRGRARRGPLRFSAFAIRK